MTSRQARQRAEAAAPGSGKRVLYYRNPMGLPDTSPVPKKDSMGMDYIPVYEGEADDGNTVKVSPGKLQRTGVRSELVERRVLISARCAPRVRQLDETNAGFQSSSLRSERFIEKVENVTTGDHVRKGQPLIRVYSPEIAAAARAVPAPTRRLRAAATALVSRRTPPLETQRAARRHRRDRAHPEGAADRSPGGAAGRRRHGAERGRRHAGLPPATCCSASPTIRWCGCWPTFPSANSALIAEGQSVTVRVRRLPRPRVHREGRA